jgi:NitT/TauT family transport system substrate-binding protein
MKLRVVMQPYLAHAPLLLADAEGLWAKHGLEVELVPMQRATDAVPLLLSGDIDVLPSNSSPGLLNAAARGEPVRIVADRGFADPEGCTFLGLVAGPGLLENGALTRSVHRVSIDRQAAMLFMIERLLLRGGLSADTLELAEVPLAVESEALLTRTLDVAFAGEPWLTRHVARGAGQAWIRLEEVLPRHQFGFVFFGPNLLVKNREAGRRFMLAYREAVLRYLEGKTERNVAVVAKGTGDTPELVRQACWPAMRANGRIDLASLLEYQGWAVRHGFIESPAAAERLWDSTFVVYADSVFASR